MTDAKTWGITIAVLLGVLVLDLLLAIKNRKRETTLKEAAFWTIFYVIAAILFGLNLQFNGLAGHGEEFFAGWLTEYSLSVDNVFIFIILLANLNVKRESAQLILLAGIAMALVLRGIFIALGSALISKFAAAFFIFAIILIATAWKLIKEKHGDEKVYKEGRIITALRKRGASTFTIALVAVGTTDLIFALDSIPAIFGLTKDPYIVFTANAFALMGLRQLYFLLAGLVDRLIYLSKGLAVILGFIGFK
ncbi:MAG: TerC family protein, partial [Actinobacteria bacterium]|nr:TerC family protein [Actinomycetota bacterium]